MEHKPFENLEIIKKALKTVDVDVEISKRHEILINKLKAPFSSMIKPIPTSTQILHPTQFF